MKFKSTTQFIDSIILKTEFSESDLKQISETLQITISMDVNTDKGYEEFMIMIEKLRVEKVREANVKFFKNNPKALDDEIESTKEKIEYLVDSCEYSDGRVYEERNMLDWLCNIREDVAQGK